MRRSEALFAVCHTVRHCPTLRLAAPHCAPRPRDRWQNRRPTSRTLHPMPYPHPDDDDTDAILDEMDATLDESRGSGIGGVGRQAPAP